MTLIRPLPGRWMDPGGIKAGLPSGVPWQNRRQGLRRAFVGEQSAGAQKLGQA